MEGGERYIETYINLVHLHQNLMDSVMEDDYVQDSLMNKD